MRDPYATWPGKQADAAAQLAIQPGRIYALPRGAVLSPAQLVEKLAAYDVIYLGEQHDHLRQHEFQARIIAELSRSQAVAVGLEMLPQSVQPVLDAYVAGTIDERTLLERAGWYDHWGLDYRYYAPIFRTARQHGAPIVALNAPGKLVRKVGRGGLEALSPDERAQLPEQIELDSTTHRQIVAALLGGPAHAHAHREHAFERLYQAQSVWDETMGAAIVSALRGRLVGRKLVVLAGAGHVVFDVGISRRVARRDPELRQATMVLLAAEPQGRRVSREIADYALGIAPAKPAEHFPQLGVRLRLEGEQLVVQPAHGPKRGAARRLELRPGDRIVALDGVTVRSLFELKWQLQQRSWGDVVVLETERSDRRLRQRVKLEPDER